MTTTSIPTTSKPTFDTCYYHRGCSDGICAAWIVRCEYPNLKFIGIAPNVNINTDKKTGETHDDIAEYTYKNKEVIFVDVCPGKDLLEKMCALAKRIVILDHHKTNRETIESFNTSNSPSNLETVFDMTRAGCQIAWDYIYTVCPNNGGTNLDLNNRWFVDYIADRDLWTWKLKDSKHINSALHGLGYSRNFEGFDKLDCEGSCIIESELLPFAKAIDIQNEQMLKRYVYHSKWCRMNVKGTYYNVWVASSYELRSELGNRLVHRGHRNEDGTETMPDFAVMWTYNFEGHEWWVSLRASQDTDMDVSAIAKQMDPNGGGHPKAAGFTYKSDTTEQIHDFLELL